MSRDSSLSLNSPYSLALSLFTHYDVSHIQLDPCITAPKLVSKYNVNSVIIIGTRTVGPPQKTNSPCQLDYVKKTRCNAPQDALRLISTI